MFIIIIFSLFFKYSFPKALLGIKVWGVFLSIPNCFDIFVFCIYVTWSDLQFCYFNDVILYPLILNYMYRSGKVYNIIFSTRCFFLHTSSSHLISNFAVFSETCNRILYYKVSPTTILFRRTVQFDWLNRGITFLISGRSSQVGSFKRNCFFLFSG